MVWIWANAGLGTAETCTCTSGIQTKNVCVVTTRYDHHSTPTITAQESEIRIYDHSFQLKARNPTLQCLPTLILGSSTNAIRKPFFLKGPIWRHSFVTTIHHYPLLLLLKLFQNVLILFCHSLSLSLSLAGPKILINKFGYPNPKIRTFLKVDVGPVSQNSDCRNIMLLRAEL